MAFLGVEASLTGRRWVGPGVEAARQAEAIAQACALPLPLCQTLARLGVAPEDAAPYLAPTLRDLLPDPRGLRDMETAADRLTFFDADEFAVDVTYTPLSGSAWSASNRRAASPSDV